jgi:UDP-N-acetylglucosamine 4,6-dehydratase/5-epimerase
LSLEGKTILITGGTGSFGKKFAEIALLKNPKKLIVFSRDELKQSQMDCEFLKYKNHDKLRFFIGDVRDYQRLKRATENVDILVHTAALKQVPSCEYSPMEAVKTNVFGTSNVLEVCIDNGVEKAILLSTDKSVNPVNLYGSTKLTAEKLFVQSNSYVGSRNTKLSCVRYGNVLGSRGSVIPLFQKQRDEDGVINITDNRMTRFWITLEKAVNFVIYCLEIMEGGEVFIPKIPSMKIIDLADVIAPDTPKAEVGIRPGEKIHEVLLTALEASHAREFDNHYVIEPLFPFWRGYSDAGARLPEGFEYRSDTNEVWLNKEGLRILLGKEI